jgi:hypothetical protein
MSYAAHFHLKSVLWTPIGFNADLDPDPGSQTYSDPDSDPDLGLPGQTLSLKK